MEEFKSVKNNPFLVIENFADFINAIDELDTRFTDLQLGEAQEIHIPIRKDISLCSEDWNIMQVILIINKISHLDLINPVNPKLVIKSSPEEIKKTLQFIYFLLSPEERLQCSFDTYTEDCPGNNEGFFIIGNSGSCIQKYAEIISLSPKKKISGNESFYSDEKFLWRVWFAAISTNDTVKNFQFLPITRILIKALTGQKIGKPQDLNPDACKLFYKYFSKQVNQKIFEIVVSISTINIAKFIASDLSMIIKENPIPLFISMITKNLESKLFCEILIQCLRENSSPGFVEDEWKKIEKIAQDSNNQVLAFLSKVYCKKVNEKELNSILNQMDFDDFEQALFWLLNPIDPVYYIHISKLELLFHKPELKNMTDRQLINFIHACFRINVTNFPDGLISKISILDLKLFKKVVSLTKKYKTVPPMIQKAIKERQMEMHKENNKKKLFW